MGIGFALLIINKANLTLYKTMDSKYSTTASFSVPHAFEDLFGQKYTVREKYFYVMLRKLFDRFKSDDGWFSFADTIQSKDRGVESGFEYFGLSARVCKSARRKLKEDGLIETRYVHGEKGYRKGTGYRLLDAKLADHNKTTHRAIMGQLGGPKGAQGDETGQNQRVLRGIGGVHISAGYNEPFAASLSHE